VSEYILEMRGISKTFPGVKALDNVQLLVKPGEVHALMGENGAGKSTLMKILMGIYTKDAGQGEILFDGKPYKASNPKEAMDTGIAMIHQELNPILDMTVYENIFVGREIKKHGLVDKRAMAREAKKLIDEYGLHISPNQTLRDLTVAQCQLIEIIKAISINAKVIVMDEPTAAITEREVDTLFQHIRTLKSKGVAIIYISHRMDEIFQICDTISVFRDGQFIGMDAAKDLTENDLIKMMVGREITDQFPKLESKIGDVVFEAKNIVRADKKVKDVSISVRSGEILGIAGLVGAGRSELVESIFGVQEKSGGEVFIKGKKINVKHPKDIIKEGVALVTEDRKVTGLNLVGTVNENIAMVAIDKTLQGGLYSKRKADKAAQEYIEKLSIKTPSGNAIVGNLSGGNQQKVVIAKWLLNDPDIIIMDEPTRGIDVGAKRDIYLLMGSLVQQGKAVIMISGEIPELMGVCDRIAVMAEGNLSGELERKDFSQEKIMALASAIQV
jgi:ABC-type sugar transport system ATPase subunit